MAVPYDCSSFDSVKDCIFYNRAFGFKPILGVAAGHAAQFLLATALVAWLVVRVRGKAWSMTHLVTITGAMECIGYAVRCWAASDASIMPVIISQFFLLVAPSECVCVCVCVCFCGCAHGGLCLPARVQSPLRCHRAPQSS